MLRSIITNPVTITAGTINGIPVANLIAASVATPFQPTVSGSPYTYTNNTTGVQQVFLGATGVTLAAVTVTRSATPISLSLLANNFTLCPGDSLTITWVLGTPTLEVIPLLS